MYTGIPVAPVTNMRYGSLSLSFSNSAFFQRKTLLTLYDPLVSIFRGNVHCGRSSYFHPVPPQKKFLHKLFHKPLPGQHVTLHLSLSALLSSLLVYDGTRLNKWQQFYPQIIDLMAQFSILWNLNLTMRSSSFQLIVFLVKKNRNLLSLLALLSRFVFYFIWIFVFVSWVGGGNPPWLCPKKVWAPVSRRNSFMSVFNHILFAEYPSHGNEPKLAYQSKN